MDSSIDPEGRFFIDRDPKVFPTCIPLLLMQSLIAIPAISTEIAMLS